MSATPFYLGNSGYPEGMPFPWLVSDFGLVDAIECGIVKIPRLPVRRRHGKEGRGGAARAEVLPPVGGHRGQAQARHGLCRQTAEADVVYKYAEAALTSSRASGSSRFDRAARRGGGQPFVPPGDDRRLRQHRHRRGLLRAHQRRTYERPTIDEKGVAVSQTTSTATSHVCRSSRTKPAFARTVRIDTKLLAKIETEEDETKDEAAKALRDLIDTVGKRGGPASKSAASSRCRCSPRAGTRTTSRTSSACARSAASCSASRWSAAACAA